jgi:outer membrane protein assembly factor BamB
MLSTRTPSVLRPWGLLATMLGLLTPAATAVPHLKPAWSAEFEARVDWVHVVGEGTAVLVATHDNQLHLVDAHTGENRWPAPLPARAGTCAAEGIAGRDFTCVFDRTQLRALHLSGTEPVAWTVGAPADPGNFTGDPDVLNRWLVAHATPEGVLGVNRNGTLLWHPWNAKAANWSTTTRPRLASVRVFTHQDTALILAQAGGEAHFFQAQLAAESPNLRHALLPQPWPIWAAVADDNLICAAPQSLTAYGPDGTRRWEQRFDQTLHNRQLAVWPGPAAEHNHRDKPQVLVAGNGVLLSWSATTGARLWRTTLPRMGESRALEVHGGRALLHNETTAIALDLRHRQVAAQLTGADQHTLTAVQLTDAYLGAIACNGSTCQLLAQPYASSKQPARRWSLHRITPPRAVCWTQRHVVLVCDRSLRAFRLPTDPGDPHDATAEEP